MKHNPELFPDGAIIALVGMKYYYLDTTSGSAKWVGEYDTIEDARKASVAATIKEKKKLTSFYA